MIKTPEVAYEPEDQMFAIEEFQQADDLAERERFFLSRRVVIEEGVSWNIIYYLMEGDRRLRSVNLIIFDCNQKLLERLREGDELTEIYSPKQRPDITFGRDEHLVAALLNKNGQPIYKSRLFDLDAYITSHNM